MGAGFTITLNNGSKRVTQLAPSQKTATTKRFLKTLPFAPSPVAQLQSSSLTTVFQIIFNEISAAEISGLSTMDQLELLNQFKVRHEDLENIQGKDGRFGTIERQGKKLYRYRSKDYRIYFEVNNNNVIVHRVLNRNTFQDFLFRSKLPLNEDEALSDSKHFWNLIKEGEEAQRI